MNFEFANSINDLIDFSRLTIGNAKVLFDVSKEKLNNPSITIALYQLWVAQLKFSGDNELGSARFSMAVMLDDSASMSHTRLGGINFLPISSIDSVS